MRISKLISDLKLHSFTSVVKQLVRIDPSFQVFVDGGAGVGETVEDMLSILPDEGKIIAYEPNPINVQNFICKSSKVQIQEAALGDQNELVKFYVSQETKSLSENPFHIAGTSFVGKVVEHQEGVISTSNTYDVRMTRLDTSLAELRVDNVDFLKLDLQGSEVSALRGLGEMLKSVKVIWVEFSGQTDLLELLNAAGFFIFDTEYLFVGQPTPLIEEFFEINKVGTNSIGKSIFFGSRKHVWADYQKIFHFMRAKRRMIQTDLLIVNPAYIHFFFDAISEYCKVSDTDDIQSIPELLNQIL